MQRPSGSSCSLELFLVQFRWIESESHPKSFAIANRADEAADPDRRRGCPNHGAILQDHVAAGLPWQQGVVGVDRLDHNRGRGSARASSLNPRRRCFRTDLLRPSSDDLLPHLNLGVAVGIQNGLAASRGNGCRKAVRHLRDSARFPSRRCSALVRTPERIMRSAQNLGPLLGLSDQASNLWGRCRE